MSVDDTGRIRKPLNAKAREVLFERHLPHQLQDDMPYVCDVDRAHLIMLAENGLVPRANAARALTAIDRLAGEDFAPLRTRPATRGLFLLYENYLIETEDPEIGGILQLGRSRNDLKATIQKLRARAAYQTMIRGGIRLELVLLRMARRYWDVVMPLYTHGQAAVPGAYGHYLAGVAQAVGRDLDALMNGSSDLDSCPLGAGAIGGSNLPIDTRRTASLLGFEHQVSNSVDAIASRDWVLRLLQAAAIFGVTLSRLATDLMEWSTAEFDFLRLPDELVGSSSAMPNKRNPFLLEHVQGGTAATLGTFVAAATAMHAKPFTNTIAVGTEGVEPLWASLQQISDSCLLLRLTVAGARPNREVMIQRAHQGFTGATALANQMVAECGIDFRTAHRKVGEAVLHAAGCDGPSRAHAALGYLQAEGFHSSLATLDPETIAAESEYGGGPGSNAIRCCIEAESTRLAARLARVRSRAMRWRLARERLLEEAKLFAAGSGAARKAQRIIEMRSDTFTLPTSRMYAAIASAPLGNDEYGEDPTVKRLEKLAAGMLGKEAACLMPSGTMANLTAILACCGRGGRVLVGDQSDIFVYEGRAGCEWGGIQYDGVATQPDGTLRIEDLEQAVLSGVKPSLISIENPHNLRGGVVLPLSYLARAADFARENSIHLHLDGARLFNAAVAQRINASRIAACADSLQFCLSKGLSAPVGSMVVGSASFIESVRCNRKLLGGGMRQAGIVAAAGIVALEQMTKRLEEDHRNARKLAEGLASLPRISLDLDSVQTNIVVFRVDGMSGASFIDALCDRGIHVGDFLYGRIRAAVHSGISSEDIDVALAVIRDVVETNQRRGA
jgi:argininosuccinate lyase